ncbi:MAG: hypothetical protein H0X28_10680 [Solirubrobacterales bacterium]|nr:hypothetical protein [Solirubrobacterales bacterium]
MHLYAIAANLPSASARRLAHELRHLGAEFGLDGETLWSTSSRSGALAAGGIHHSAARCAPRVYLSQTEGVLTWFDGLPVSTRPGQNAHDARELAGSWESVGEELEGQFSVARLALEHERAEIVTDALGVAQVFCARHQGGVLVSNSATLIAAVLDLHVPDPLGVCSFLGLGWAAGASTLNGGIEVLCGGSRHIIEHSGLRTHQSFGPRTIPAKRGRAIPPAELAERMTTITGNAVAGMPRVGCALTGGRDTRVMVALLRAAGEEALYFTGGEPTSPDVVIATELAEMLGLQHELVQHDPASSAVDWTEAASRFVAQNDGLASLLQLPDYIELPACPPPLGVKLWGVGGEIGRTGTGFLTAIATNAPLLQRSNRIQRKLLGVKSRDDGGVMTREARHELARYLDRFHRERLEEGWTPDEIQEAFYTFERVGRWGGTGPRRMAATDDIFGPFVSRLFIDYCYSLSSKERYVEAAHYRLLSEISASLRDHRYDTPFPTPRPWLAPALATRQLAIAIRKRLRDRRRADSLGGPSSGAPDPEYPFQHAWLEARLPLIRDIFSTAESPLWDYVSRPRIEHLLNGSEAERAHHQEGLLRALSIFWHFHGPRPGGGAQPHAAERSFSTPKSRRYRLRAPASSRGSG